jgi:hypothetical protein
MFNCRPAINCLGTGSSHVGLSENHPFFIGVSLFLFLYYVIFWIVVNRIRKSDFATVTETSGTGIRIP